MDLEPAIHLRLRASRLRPGEAVGAGGGGGRRGRWWAQGEAAPHGGGAAGVHGWPTAGPRADTLLCGASADHVAVHPR